MGKTFGFLLLLMAIQVQTSGQVKVNSTGMPTFSIRLTNGNPFSYKEIVKNKPVMLIYFAPECDHCRKFVKKLTDRMNDLKQLQIILISYLPLPDLQKFNHEFRLDRFPNVKMGTEGNSFLVPAFFKIVKFPFTALYNKTGRLSAIYREEPPLNVLTDFSKQP